MWEVERWGEPVCSADAERPPALWQEIKDTFPTPLPLKIWATDHSIGRTWSVEEMQTPRPRPRPAAELESAL